ncbi:MAG TPA: ABC transporter permease [Acidimicrobiales bacterium]|nr:ABC transporter permease [Acidimicrobiales bacterium]
MSVATTASTVTLPAPTLAPTRPVSRTTAFAALSRRRVALSAHTPRELLVPLVTPILFADVIAPALAKTMGVFRGIDYVSFVAVGTIGLLVPLACVLGGVGMIVDRQSGSQRDLLAAPIPRSLLVLGNLSVALVVSALQVAALFAASVLRGADFHVTASGVLWAGAAVLALAIAMHGVAEVLASKLKTQEEYIGAAPPIALVPWFFAGSFFPISAMPAGLTVFAKVLPLTHALAVLRYALVDGKATGLHDIWGMSNVTAMAALSLTVVVAFAGLMTAAGIRAFTRSAIS